MGQLTMVVGAVLVLLFIFQFLEPMVTPTLLRRNRRKMKEGGKITEGKKEDKRKKEGRKITEGRKEDNKRKEGR
jgi:hypothetical protein